VNRLGDRAVFARHCVYVEEEYRMHQRFHGGAELMVNAGNTVRKDTIAGTVAYRKAFSVIEALVTGKRRFPVEALALDATRRLSDRFPTVAAAKTTARKAKAPVNGAMDHVEVRLAWPE